LFICTIPGYSEFGSRKNLISGIALQIHFDLFFP
jgi:hypothetical protein